MNIRSIGVASGALVAAALCLSPLTTVQTVAQGSPTAPHHQLIDSAHASSSLSFEAAHSATYRVQSGNTLAGIASQFHTTWETLASMNHLANPNVLRIGEVLSVPGGQTTLAANEPATAKASSAVRRYTVEAGNTLAGIAAMFHTTWPILAQLNHLSNPNNIAVGEVLILPGSSSAIASGSNSVSLPMQDAPSSVGAAIVSTALKYLGVPYVFGDENPATGFDCSGLVQYVLAQNGISIGRTTWEQYDEVTHVSKANLEPGDLVFFQTYAPGASHVGIYIGSDPAMGYSAAFIDAPEPGQGVQIQNLNDPFYVSHYYGAGTVN